MTQLQSPWVFYYTHREPHVKTASQNYEEQMKPVACFGSVQEFWSAYQHMHRPSEMPAISEYVMFRRGIRPVWEDDFNIGGGKLVVRFKKGIADRLWERLILAVIGEQLVGHDSDQVCGIVLSCRANEDIMSIWNHESSQSTAALRQSLKTVLELPVDCVIDYKPHRDAIVSIHSAFH